MGHAERHHAILSASGAHRWLKCTPSALLESQFPDTTSTAAQEGTVAHELAEIKLRHYFQPVEFGRAKLTRGISKLKKHELWQDEMLGYTEEYLDFVKETALSMKTSPYVAIEKRVDLTHYIPGGFGTADCILIGGGRIHVIDFKYGKGVPVSAEENPQMMLYALGAYEAYQMLYQITDVTVSIVQPRISSEASSWDLPLGDLIKFGEYVKERAGIAIKGEGEYAPDDEACRFCRAKAQCRARADHNIKLAFFTGTKPPLISKESVGEYLKIGEGVARWLEDLKAYALSECLAGRDIPGWKAVEGRGSRSWIDIDSAFAELKKRGIDEAMLYERKPLTPPQVEKLVGKNEFNEFAKNYVNKTKGKPTLVPESDKREAITNQLSAAEVFGEA